VKARESQLMGTRHNTDNTMFKSLVQELSRVTKTMIVIMEDIGEGQSETGEWILGRDLQTRVR
jgi:hypothetical protein